MAIANIINRKIHFLLHLLSKYLPLVQQVQINQLTNYSTELPEKLTGSQLVKKFPTFYGTRMFITAFTTAPS